LKNYSIIVFKRPGHEPDKNLPASVEICDAPLLDISSTYIRTMIAQKKSIRYLVTEEVMEEILANGYYRKTNKKA
jgi:nicotinate-nucleotide adenylyltransferase